MTPKCKMWMMGKIAIPVFFIFFVLFTAVAVDVTAASTIVLNGTSIQRAVNMANDGDEIIVYPGKYMENIDVDKSVSIRSSAGASDTVVEAYDMSKSVFHVTADYVNISGFTMKYGWEGIFLDNVSYCNILNNSIKFNYDKGIYLDSSSNNSIKSNFANSNDGEGISLSLSYNNTIRDNIADSNKKDGVSLTVSENNNIINNTLEMNSENGV
jgi:nitrous oxidase accessory protein